jgi:hypothetical protein
MHGKMVKTPDLEGSVPTGGGATPSRGEPPPMSSGCRATPERRPYLSVGGKQREARSWHARGLRPCMTAEGDVAHTGLGCSATNPG